MLIGDKETWRDALKGPTPHPQFFNINMGPFPPASLGLSLMLSKPILRLLPFILIYGFKIANLGNEAVQ